MRAVIDTNVLLVANGQHAHVSTECITECVRRLQAMEKTGVTSFLLYGISSGALKAALFTERHPERVAKLALDAFVWTGEGSHTLEQRKKKLPLL